MFLYLKKNNLWENSGLGAASSNSIAASTSTRNDLKKEIEGYMMPKIIFFILFKK